MQFNINNSAKKLTQHLNLRLVLSENNITFIYLVSYFMSPMDNFILV